MLRKKKSVLSALTPLKEGDKKMIFIKSFYSFILLQVSVFCVSMERGI